MSHPRYVIQTRRLGMRRYVGDDAEALRAVFADPYAAKFYPAMGDTAALERLIDWNLRNYADHGFGLWALELRETGAFIGDAGITYQTPEGERILEVGWHVHPAFRSMGCATEAAEACLQFGFADLKADALASIVDPANAASIKVATRVHAGHRVYEGRSGPMLLFGTTAVEFAARQRLCITKTTESRCARLG
jgi:[ribosomal protein S5]-alanine N-acetyltransferase